MRRLRLAIVTSLLVGMTLPAATAVAFPGDPVTTYGDSGVARLNVGTTPRSFDHIDSGIWVQTLGQAIDSDGRLIVAGSAAGHATVTRFTAAGAPDATFGDAGTAIVDLGGVDVVHAVAVQSDGRIVVAGASLRQVIADDYRTKFVVTRLLADGSVDPAFHSGTPFVTSWPGDNVATAAAVAITAGGDIVVAGHSNVLQGMPVVELTSAGALKTSFGNNGRALVPLPSFGWANAVAIDSSGRVVVAGAVYGNTGLTVAVGRLTAAGAVDTTFGTQGLVTTDAGGASEGNALTFDSNGKLLVGATTDQNGSNGGPRGAVIRYTTAGAPDATFSGDGIAPLSLSTADGVAIAGTAVLVGGTLTSQTGVPQAAAQRLTSGGGIDSNFGDAGVASRIGPRSNVGLQGAGLLVTSGGAVLVPGRVNPEGPGTYGEPALAGWDNAGTPLAGFGDSGVAHAALLGPSADVIADAVIGSDGSVVAVGETNAGDGDLDVVVARMLPDGTADPDFGNGGVTTIDLGGDEVGVDIAVQSDGKIVVVGTALQHILVARLTTTGALDDTFAGDGTFVHAPDDSFNTEYGRAVAIDSQGRIVAGGVGYTPGQSAQLLDMEALRLTSGGVLDTTFSGDGVVTTDAGGLNGVTNSRNDAVGAVAIRPGDGVLLGGAAYAPNGASDPLYLPTVAAYGPTGTPDTSVGGDGVATVAVAAGSGGAEINDIALGSGGLMLVTGYTGLSAHPFVSRLTAAGALDATFATQGTFISAREGYGNAVMITPAGQLLVAVGTGGASGSWKAMRLNANGTPDPTFGDEGIAASVIDTYQNATAVGLSAGNVVLAGTSRADFVATRLDGTTPPAHTLTVAVTGTGGSGRITGPGIDCPGDCSATYAEGKTVTLTLEVESGVLKQWNGATCSGTTCQVTVTSDMNVSAVLGVPSYNLHVSVVGKGSVSGSGIQCPTTCDVTVPQYTNVALTAKPATAYKFVGWSGAGCSGRGTCYPSMSQNRSATATFKFVPPPNTSITDSTINSTRRKASFALKATGGIGTSTFRCRIGSNAYQVCTSAPVFTNLSYRLHTFSAYAVDKLGRRDKTPVEVSFRIRR